MQLATPRLLLRPLHGHATKGLRPRTNFLRIGAGELSWIGSFERGHKCGCCTVQMMPDRKHMFVMAGGAGYILDAKSRALVEEIGTEVVGVIENRPRTLFVVNHDDTILEAFGKSGRLWKTASIGSGGIREMAFADDAIVGEARHPSRPGWVEFSVSLATGEVRLLCRSRVAHFDG